MDSRVHVISPNDRHIVPRMAAWLSHGNGWSLSESPDPSADFNLYMPYTGWSRSPRCSTMTGAWFTHYETHHLGKIALWRAAARSMDLRVVTSPIYDSALARYGTTRLVSPGIDQEHFCIADNRLIAGRVGLVGIGSRRKGLDLVAQLARDPQFDILLAAAGKGWGITEETWTPVEHMPEFYRRLDVFLCTSTIEGIPAPPLEALACGVKVVIPSGVGMLDSLPEQEGIRRYLRGDYADLSRALRLCLNDHPSPVSLRECVSSYTIDAWCSSVRDAVREALDMRDPSNPHPCRPKRIGPLRDASTLLFIRAYERVFSSRSRGVPIP